MSAANGIERLFRHEYGRVVALLCARVGAGHIEVEDAVQSALARAVEVWPRQGTPSNPTGWLYRVALNRLRDQARSQQRHTRLLAGLGVDEAADSMADPALSGELPDAMLAMLFVCCDDTLPREAQLALALKTLCGFSVGETAAGLFTSEANVYKRLSRAREHLRNSGLRIDALGSEDIAARLPAVHAVLHVLFTEGHQSYRADQTIRAELCDEAIRLATVVAKHPQGQRPASFALVALMHLHRARLASRQDGTGGLLMLSEQDRASWDMDGIARGLQWLERASEGPSFSRYHAEAGIAAAHCLAPSFEQTRWDRIVSCYTLLERVSPSSVHRLGHAVALAEWKGPEHGLALLEGSVPPTWLTGAFPWYAVLADLHRRCGDEREAARYRSLALDTAPTPAVHALLERRLVPHT